MKLSQEIIDELILRVMAYQDIKAQYGTETADIYWTGIRKEFIFGMPGMSSEDLYDFTAEAQKQIYDHRRSLEGLLHETR